MPSVGISTNYRQIDAIEARIVAVECEHAWQDPSIPMRQYVTAVEKELAGFRFGRACAPFNALIRCLRFLTFGPNVSLLDVGASAGYYSEVLKVGGYDFAYQAIDYSPAFKELAEHLYPGIRFDVGDARRLPYRSNTFDIVLSGCCLLHILDYEQVIAETARVSSRYAIFQKTPVVLGGQTQFYEKDAYGVRCLEIHFGEAELLGLFEKHGLSMLHHEDVSKDHNLVHRTYLLRKTSIGEREWERA